MYLFLDILDIPKEGKVRTITMQTQVFSKLQSQKEDEEPLDNVSIIEKSEFLEHLFWTFLKRRQ